MLASEVYRNAVLMQVRLAESTLVGNWLEGPPSGKADIRISHRTLGSNIRDQRLFLPVAFEYEITASRTADNESDAFDSQSDAVGEHKRAPFLKISCTLVLEYSLRPEFSPTENQIRAFHEGNAVFNCWPFFREYVQSSAARMSVPPLPVPFLRLQAKEEPGAPEPQGRKRSTRTRKP